jgi:hypothetical protein
MVKHFEVASWEPYCLLMHLERREKRHPREVS